jgi:PAS domain S-box-containing protein
MTQHKTLEQDPALALRLLDTLLTYAPVGFAFLDRELRFVRVNEQLAEINGCSVEAHLGRTVAELLPSLDVALREVTARILASGQPVLDHEFTGETARAPGITRHWNESWYPVRDEHSEIIGFSGVVVEITERKQAEAEQKKNHDHLRYALHAAEAGAWNWNISSGEISWSAENYVLYDMDPGPVPPRHEDWAARLHPGDRDRVSEHVRAVLDGGAPEFRAEFRIITRQGAVRWLLCLGQVERDLDGQAVRMSGLNLNITERKRIELDLIQATAIAEKANQAKSDFLSTMSHELRTPLHAILGFAQLMETGAPAPTPAQGRYLEQIIKGGWYLLSLIEQLLDLAQIESGTMSLTEEPVSLDEVMLDCQTMIMPLACERGISMTFPAIEFPGHVRADRTRLKQVLINLLSNAIKYNKLQGTVAVEYALRPQGAIRISIRDTGEGLAPEQLAQLFQPFNRLGREAGAEQGTGIGLVMSKHLVALMGGAMGVDSVVGEGSVFWIELSWFSMSQAAA